MTDTVVAGETPKARIDWSISAGSDLVVPLRWLSGTTVVDLTDAEVTVLFSNPPTGGSGPVANHVAVQTSDGAGGTPNMVLTIPGGTTNAYSFEVMRYALLVRLPFGARTRWAEGDITFEGAL